MTLSQHFKVPRDAGLIQGCVNCPSVRYCCDEARIAWFKHQVQDL